MKMMEKSKLRIVVLLLISTLLKIGTSDEPIDNFTGIKYRLSTTDNFDALLKALGVNIWKRLLARVVSADLQLSKLNDEYILSVTTFLKDFILKFRPGARITTKTPDGRIVDCTVTFSGNVLHEIEQDENGKITYIDRTFNATHVVAVLMVDDIEATRIYTA